MSKGNDNLYRTSKLKVGDNEFTRSIAHLYPLEMEEESEDKHVEASVDVEESEDNCKDIEIENQLDIEIEPVLEETIENDVVESDHVMNDVDEFVRPLTEINMNDTSGGTGVVWKLRPRRSAATKALEKIKQWTHNLLTLL